MLLKKYNYEIGTFDNEGCIFPTPLELSKTNIHDESLLFCFNGLYAFFLIGKSIPEETNDR